MENNHETVNNISLNSIFFYKSCLKKKRIVIVINPIQLKEK